MPHGPPRTLVVASGIAIGDVHGPFSDVRPRRDVDLLAAACSVVVVEPGTWRSHARRDAVVLAAALGEPWGIAATAMRLAREADAVVALSDDIGSLCAVLRRPRRTSAGSAPLLVLCHHLASRRVRLLLGRVGLHRRIDRFLTLTVAQGQMLRRLGVPDHRSRVLGTFVDTEFFRPVHRLADDPMRDDESLPLVIAVGATGRDYATLVDAARGLDAKVAIEASSVWAGRSDVEADDPPANVEFTDLGTTAALRDQYARAAVVAVPLGTLSTLVGVTALLEGMAMAKAVVVTDAPLLAELVDHGVTGVRVAAGDVAGWHAHLADVVAHPDHHASMGARARAQVLADHRIEEYPVRVLDMVAEALDDRDRLRTKHGSAGPHDVSYRQR